VVVECPECGVTGLLDAACGFRGLWGCFGSSFGGLFSGWVDGMRMGLSMMTKLLGLWVCTSLFRWVVVLVVISGTWCI
jgi:hypothetical protein